MIFHGVASFTFRIMKAKTLSESTVFRGFYGKKRITCNLEFSKEGDSFKGKGLTAGDGKEFQISGQIQRKIDQDTSWIGYYKQEGVF